jgi:metal-dependent amidase/aminoacylase/carboxypeptidase family protein
MTARMAPVLARASDNNSVIVPQTGAAEDFSSFLNEVPGLFFYVGVVPRGQDPATAPPNHSPNFMIDESALVVGARALSSVAVNFLAGARTY